VLLLAALMLMVLCAGGGAGVIALVNRPSRDTGAAKEDQPQPKAENRSETRSAVEKAVRRWVLDHANDDQSVTFVTWGPHDLKSEIAELLRRYVALSEEYDREARAKVKRNDEKALREWEEEKQAYEKDQKRRQEEWEKANEKAKEARRKQEEERKNRSKGGIDAPPFVPPVAIPSPPQPAFTPFNKPKPMPSIHPHEPPAWMNEPVPLDLWAGGFVYKSGQSGQTGHQGPPAWR
jgi:hypothetical protein